jgi:methionyl-tRNA formyltransferase
VKHNYNVVGVVTMPDKQAGRGQQLQESAVKKYAVSQGLRVLQPEKFRDEEFIKELKSLHADIQVVVAFRMLPEVIWNMPPLGTYNVHASLLPDYRGAAPINWVLINGEQETGVTTFKLQQEIDTGSILFQEKVELCKNTTAGELHDKLMHIGAGLILKTMKAIERNEYTLLHQDTISTVGKEMHHAPKLTKEICKIKWNDYPGHIHNLIRGLSPYPAAWTEIRDERGEIKSMKIFSSRYEEGTHELQPGTILSDNRTFLKVTCKQGYVLIEELQLAGKKRMEVPEFLKGFHFKPEFIFC